MNIQALVGLSIAVAGVLIGSVTALFAYPALRQRLQDRDVQRFRDARGYLKEHRASLSVRAQQHYGERPVIDGVPLLAAEGWICRHPRAFADVLLAGNTYARPVAPVAQLKHLWPRTSWRRYPTYADAVRSLDLPLTFENRPCYRLLDVAGPEETPTLTFGECRYFDFMDTCEAVGYETALAEMGRTPRRSSRIRGAAARDALGSALVFANRNAVAGVNTLTIRHDRETGRAWFFMHDRSKTGVASAMGVFHVAPAGEFQPSTLDPDEEAWSADMDLWLTMIREYNEEFLGAPEAAAVGGSPLDYGTEPYASFNRARLAGAMTPYYLGVAVDPLSLKPEILTACVIEATAFADLFGRMVDENQEGELIVGADKHGIPFDERHVRTYLPGGRAATLPAGAGCLALAWSQRRFLLRGTPPEGIPGESQPE